MVLFTSRERLLIADALTDEKLRLAEDKDNIVQPREKFLADPTIPAARKERYLALERIIAQVKLNNIAVLGHAKEA